MIQRTMREWERLPYGTEENEIPQEVATLLLDKADKIAFNKVLCGYREAIQARNYVGVLTVPGCQLEILPKIEGSASASEASDADELDGQETKLDQEEAGQLRKRLVRLLGVVLDLDIKEGEIAQLGVQTHTLLEVLIRLFIKKLWAAVRRGLPQHYLNKADDLPTLRGRLDVMRQFSHLAASPQKLACRYDERSSDILLNQIMKASVDTLLRWTRSLQNQQSLRELSLLYADVLPIPLKGLRWDCVSLDRTMRHWETPFRLARLLLEHQFQATSTGTTNGISLLFDMNLLFEKYIAHRARTALAGETPKEWDAVEVVPQGGKECALYQGEKGSFQTKPDILFRDKKGKGVTCIIDTKWKCLNPEDAKIGVSQADVYQMMAYAQLYQCENIILLYPCHHGMKVEQEVDYQMFNKKSDYRLTVATIDMFCNEHNAREKIEKRIINLLPR